MQGTAASFERLLDAHADAIQSPLRPMAKAISRVVTEKDYIKAKNCLSFIDDPLWRHVCHEIINMMGPASLLKIWDSRLGEISSQGKTMEIHCQTEEASQFIQQYAFVILASLQPYFPALKQLSVETIPSRD